MRGNEVDNPGVRKEGGLLRDPLFALGEDMVKKWIRGAIKKKGSRRDKRKK